MQTKRPSVITTPKRAISVASSRQRTHTHSIVGCAIRCARYANPFTNERKQKAMRWLVWYIRSWFCSHKWEYAECNYEYSNGGLVCKTGPKVSATCESCGWHRSYWKF